MTDTKDSVRSDEYIITAAQLEGMQYALTHIIGHTSELTASHTLAKEAFASVTGLPLRRKPKPFADLPYSQRRDLWLRQGIREGYLDVREEPRINGVQRVATFVGGDDAPAEVEAHGHPTPPPAPSGPIVYPPVTLTSEQHGQLRAFVVQASQYSEHIKTQAAVIASMLTVASLPEAFRIAPPVPCGPPGTEVFTVNRQYVLSAVPDLVPRIEIRCYDDAIGTWGLCGGLSLPPSEDKAFRPSERLALALQASSFYYRAFVIPKGGET